MVEGYKRLKHMAKKEMLKEVLQQGTKEDVYEFIRRRLEFPNDVAEQLRYANREAFKKEHRRFDMSGYEGEKGQCTLHNLSIVNEFADLGIYDYTDYLFLDFYKGNGTLYMQYFQQHENFEIDLGGLGTVDIIYLIFEKTIFSGYKERRRI